MTATFALSCIVVLLLLALFGSLRSRSTGASSIVYGTSVAVSLILLAGALTALLDGAAPSRVTLPLGLPWLGAHFRVDALSAFFLLVVNLGATAANLYALGYGRHEEAPERVLPFHPAFLAGMNLVVLADDAFSFLVAWEFMSLSSWALVVAHHRDRDNVYAGYIYLVMASFGTLALLLAFGLLAGADGLYGFDSIRAEDLTPGIAALALILVLIGTGSKAGLIPLHVWLPLAHAAAPSHISALMSGVMTKVAIYGFIRITFDLLGEPVWWWSTLVLFVGAVTSVLGILYALMQRDLKRVFAYSTIENIGVIFVALGLALAFEAEGIGWASALAMTAGLFHVLNHSLFKSLLFFGAGAVANATGERDMERLGGLIHRMPKTAFASLAGCIAISALPPLNGFASEWLVFQAVLLSPQLPSWGLKLLVPAVGALLALAAVLAAACFVRAFGITFLGRPRTPIAEQATETDSWSLAAMFALAALCLLAGLFPGVVIDALAPVVQSLTGDRMPVQTAIPWLSIAPIAESRSSYNGLLVFLFIAFSASIAVYIIHRFASHALRRSAAWDCGYPDPNPITQYSAGSFAQPLRRVFGTTVFQAREQVEMPPPGDQSPARLVVTVRDLVWEVLYARVEGAVMYLADLLNYLQFLTIRRYLSLVFASLVGLLLVIAIWG